MSRLIQNNVAVHHVPQVIRSHYIAQQNALVRRGQRAGSFFVVPPAPVEEQPKVTSALQEVTRRYVIQEAQVTEDAVQYELLDADGEVLWSGLGFDRVDGLLKMMIRLVEGEDPDRSNN